MCTVMLRIAFRFQICYSRYAFSITRVIVEDDVRGRTTVGQ